MYYKLNYTYLGGPLKIEAIVEFHKKEIINYHYIHVVIKPWYQ